MSSLDSRALRELELLEVARNAGLPGQETSASPVPAGSGTADAVRAAPGTTTEEIALAARPAFKDWDALRAAVRDCTRCPLSRERKQAVFGVGSQEAPWLFVGEGPGADEDEQGEPFVGQAGKLLDNMLAAAGLKRGREVYIANVVKCRPPGNRTPKPEEAAACADYLDRQFELIHPRIVVALGKTAAVRLLGESAAETSLGSLRNKVHRYRGTALVITYHPAYLLRNLVDKSKAWDDLLLARRTLAAPSP